MGSIIDLTGQKFHRWTVRKFSHQVGKVVYWDCVCECGVLRSVFGGDLKRGGSKSCGCLTREVSATRLRKHDLAGHPAYRSWKHLLQRCLNPNNDGYDDYGGRGISVCDQWKTFEGFWADMASTWKHGASIDRIDNDKGYEPGNCRWATPKQQGNNRRSNRIINTPKGPMSVTEAAEEFGINRQTISSRLRYGWPEDRLLE